MARNSDSKITKRKKKKFLEHFAKSMNKSKCARAIRTNRCTINKWTNSDPEFAQAIEDILDAFMDAVESRHFSEAIKGTGKGATVSCIIPRS